VSDLSGGQGWWLAADGRWYPPRSTTASSAPSAVGLIVADPSASLVRPPFSETDFALGPGPAVHKIKRRRPVPGAAIVAVVAAAVVVAAVVVVTGRAGSGWVDPSLHVVGSPVAADGVVVMLDVTARHRLELSAVDPADGSVAWRRPFSASEITPGVAFGPTVLGGTVLDLVPAASVSDPTVTVEGLDVLTGRVLWSVPQPLVLSDAPAVCGGATYFCLAAFTSDTSTALVTLDPGTGRPVGLVAGPYRNMAVAQPGSVQDGDLWQTSTATPTLMQISATGQEAWTRTVAALFGGSQFDPDDGWAFLVKGGLDVGSVASAPSGGALALGDSKTIGISGADGTVRWSVPGYYFCGGGLQFLTADVVCQFSGSAHQAGSSFSMAGVDLVLKGLDTTSGATTWALPVREAEALSLGRDVAFADATHVVVQPLSGRPVVLDVVSGATVPVGTGQVFWCEYDPRYDVTTAQGASVGGQRQGAPVFGGCSASGSAVAGLPASAPSTVGVESGGMFVWPSPHGLQAAHLPA